MSTKRKASATRVSNLSNSIKRPTTSSDRIDVTNEPLSPKMAKRPTSSKPKTNGPRQTSSKTSMPSELVKEEREHYCRLLNDKMDEIEQNKSHILKLESRVSEGEKLIKHQNVMLQDLQRRLACRNREVEVFKQLLSLDSNDIDQIQFVLKQRTDPLALQKTTIETVKSVLKDFQEISAYFGHSIDLEIGDDEVEEKYGVIASTIKAEAKKLVRKCSNLKAERAILENRINDHVEDLIEYERLILKRERELLSGCYPRTSIGRIEVQEQK